MAKFDLKFLDEIEPSDFIQVTAGTNDEHGVLIIITGSNLGCAFEIALDKSTAIKFAKTLRTEINKIQD